MEALNIKKRKKGNIFVYNRSEISFHLLLLPAVVFTAIFAYWPLFGIVMAFQKYTPADGFFGSPWVGLDNFTYIFSLPNIWQVFYNTVFMAFWKMLLGLVVPITFALMLNEILSSKFKKITQTLVYLPNFISWVILAGIFVDLLSPSEGMINYLIKGLGLKPLFFLGDPSLFPWTMIITDIWKGFGYGTIIYLAALTSIDLYLYESAVIDGAGRWKQTWHITLPGMRPIIVLMAVLSLGGILNAGFDQIFNLYGPAVYSTGDVLDTFLYRLGLVNGAFSPAAAVGLLRSVVSLIFIAASYVLADKLADYRIF